MKTSKSTSPKQKDNIEYDLKETRLEVVDWINLAHDRGSYGLLPTG
jgi:hypothetical protein